MNPYFLLAVVVAWGASIGGAYWHGRETGRDSCISEQARDVAVAAIASEAAASATAKAIAGIKVQNRTINQEVRREVVEKPVYRDCLHSDVQRLRIDEALTGKRPEPAGSGIVPRADSAIGSILRRDD